MSNNEGLLSKKAKDLTFPGAILLNVVASIIGVGSVIGSLGLAVMSKRAIKKVKKMRN